jgi:peptide/nickel transport system substrate-binding protein
MLHANQVPTRSRKPVEEAAMRDRRHLLGAGVAGVFALALCVTVGVAPAAGAREAPHASGTTLTIGQTAPLTKNFSPYSIVAGNYAMMYQLYDTLIRETPTLKIQPRLATGWKFSKDGLSMTLHLRKARFSNGAPITSEVIKYDLSVMQDPATAANAQALASQVTSVDTPSARTVVLHFGAPFPEVFDLLNLLFITDPATVNSTFATVTASGPYEVQSYNPGVGYTLVRNPYFWGPRANISTITVKFLPDEQTMIDTLKTGSIDFAYPITPFDAYILASNRSYRTGTAPLGSAIYSLMVNVAKPPLDNPDVRQALSLALDRQKIFQVAVESVGRTACLPFIVPTQLGYVPSLARSCKFDLAAAKAKLQASGVSPSSLSFTVITSTQVSPVLTQMAEIFQADLAKIGVTLNIQDVAPTAWNAAAHSGTFDLLATPYGRANLDPGTLFLADIVWYATDNPTHFSDPTYAALVQKADTSTNPKVRAKLYAQIDEIILKQNFILPVAGNPLPYVKAKGLRGLRWAVNGQPLLEAATLG